MLEILTSGPIWRIWEETLILSKNHQQIELEVPSPWETNMGNQNLCE
jgi:hypothetical protein